VCVLQLFGSTKIVYNESLSLNDIHNDWVLSLTDRLVHIGNTTQFFERRFAILNRKQVFHSSVPLDMALIVNNKTKVVATSNKFMPRCSSQLENKFHIGNKEHNAHCRDYNTKGE
jgi:hypothetical protein